MDDSLACNGFEVEHAVLTQTECAELGREYGPADRAGRRGLLNVAVVRTLARSPRLVDLVRPHVGGEPFPVRAILFNKSPQANWPVAWHQDVTIAVREKSDVPEFGPWSVKNDFPHVQPPVAVLEKMLAVRLHLDDADDANGALRVLPGTHRFGRLSAEQILELRSERQEVVCCAKAGDALFMRPLLLHASSRSTSQGERRVLHIEYAAEALPGGLEWRDRV